MLHPIKSPKISLLLNSPRKHTEVILHILLLFPPQNSYLTLRKPPLPTLAAGEKLQRAQIPNAISFPLCNNE